MTIRSADYGNSYIAIKSIGKVLSELVGSKQHPNSIQEGIKSIRCMGDTILLNAFKSVISDIENQISKGKISESQAQIIMYVVFAGFSREANFNYALSYSNCVPTDVGPIKEILGLYKASNLSEPYRIRDTDGDGLLDPDEIAQVNDIFTNERIHVSARRVANERGEELRKAIQNPKHSKPNQGSRTYMTYVGDLGIRYGKRNDGYIFFEPKKVKSPTEHGNFKIPNLLRLDKRDVTTKAKEIGGYGSQLKTVLLIRRKQGQELAATLASNSKLYFYKKNNMNTSDPTRDLYVGRTVYIPFKNNDNNELTDIAIAYQEAYITVNTDQARISPYEWNNRVRVFNEKRRIATKAILIRLDRATKEQIEKYAKLIREEKENLKNWAEIFSSEFELIAVAVHNGILKVDIDSEGKVNLELQKGKLSNEDFRKIRSKFEGHIRNFNKSLNVSSPKLNQAITNLNRGGKEYYKYANSYDFQTYLNRLKPEERAEEMSKVANALVGTEAGEHLSEDLWNAVHYRNNKKNNLAEMIVNEPTPRSLITTWYLSVVAQVAVISVKFKPEEDKHRFYLRLLMGRKLNVDETNVLQQLIEVNLKTEAKSFKNDKQRLAYFTKSMNAFLKKAFVEYPGPASHVLHAYGHTVHHAHMESIIARQAQMESNIARQAHAKKIIAQHNAMKGTSHISLAKQHRALLKQIRPWVLQPNFQSRPSWKHRGVMAGAAGFSIIGFGLSISHLIHRQKPIDYIHFGVEGFNASIMLIGAAESWMTKSNKWFKRAGKYGGPLVSLAHVVMDTITLGTKGTTEGKVRAGIQLAGSVAIGVGSTWLASNPIGWMIAVGGLIAKIGAGNTDPKYEFAYQELKKLSAYREF